MNQIISYIKNKINKKQKIKITMNKNMNKKIFSLAVIGIAALSLLFVSGIDSAQAKVVGDLPGADTGDFYIAAYSDAQDSPCDGTPDTSETKYAEHDAVTGDTTYNNDSDYLLDFDDADNSTFIYFCEDGTTNILSNIEIVHDGGAANHVVDLGRVTGNGLHADLASDYIIVCEGSTQLTTVDKQVAANTYNQFFPMDDEDSTYTDLKVYFTNGAADGCTENGTKSTAKVITKASALPDNYAVYTTFGPETKAVGDLHVDLDAATMALVDGNSYSIGWAIETYTLAGAPDGLDDADDDYAIYYDKPGSDTGTFTLTITSASNGITTVSGVDYDKFTAGYDFVNDVEDDAGGGVPADIALITTDMAVGADTSVVFSTVLHTTNLYDMYTDLGAASQTIYFQKPAATNVYSKAIASNVLGDDAIDVAKVSGTAHADISTGDNDLFEVYSDATCTTEVSAIDANGAASAYEVYFEEEGSGAWYIKVTQDNGGTTYESCGNQISGLATQAVTQDLDRQVTAVVPTVAIGQDTIDTVLLDFDVGGSWTAATDVWSRDIESGTAYLYTITGDSTVNVLVADDDDADPTVGLGVTAYYVSKDVDAADVTLNVAGVEGDVHADLDDGTGASDIVEIYSTTDCNTTKISTAVEGGTNAEDPDYGIFYEATGGATDYFALFEDNTTERACMRLVNATGGGAANTLSPQYKLTTTIPGANDATGDQINSIAIDNNKDATWDVYGDNADAAGSNITYSVSDADSNLYAYYGADASGTLVLLKESGVVLLGDETAIIGVLSGDIDPAYVSTNVTGAVSGDANGLVGVYLDWANNTPTGLSNSHYVVEDGTDTYAAYVDATAGTVVSPDVKVKDSAGYVSWTMNVGNIAGGASVDVDLAIKVNGDTPDVGTDNRAFLVDDDAQTTALAAGIPDTSTGLYVIYTIAHNPGAMSTDYIQGLFQTPSNANLATNKKLIRNISADVTPLADSTWYVSKVSGASNADLATLVVYTDVACSTAVSSETVNPTTTYAQYFEGIDATPYYIGTADATHTTCQKTDISLSAQEATANFDRKLSGSVPDEDSTTIDVLSLTVDTGTEEYWSDTVNGGASNTYAAYVDSTDSAITTTAVVFKDAATGGGNTLLTISKDLTGDGTVDVSAAQGNSHASIQGAGEVDTVCYGTLPTSNADCSTQAATVQPGAAATYEIFFEQISAVTTYYLQIADSDTGTYYSWNKFTSGAAAAYTNVELDGKLDGYVAEAYDSPTTRVPNVTIKMYTNGGDPDTNQISLAYSYTGTTTPGGNYRMYGNLTDTNDAQYAKASYITQSAVDVPNLPDTVNIDLISGLKITVKYNADQQLVEGATVSLYECSDATTCPQTTMDQCTHPSGNCTIAGDNTAGNGSSGEYYFTGMTVSDYVQVKVEKTGFDTVWSPDPVALGTTDTAYAVSDSSQVSMTIYLINPSPSSPTLVSPENGLVTIDTTPDLAWVDLGGDETSYEVQVDDSADFSSVHAGGGTTANGATNTWTVDTALTTNTLYYWRVRGCDSNCGDWSPAGNFYVNTGWNSMAAPTLANTAGTSQVTVSWAALTGANNYKVYKKSSSPVANTDTYVGDTAGVSFVDSSADGTWFYAVEPIDITNTAGTISSPSATSVTVDTVAPTITASTPQGGFYNAAQELSVTTDTASTCYYSISDISYAAMAAGGGTVMVDVTNTHTATPTPGAQGLINYYVRCRDDAGSNDILSSAILYYTYDTVVPTYSLLSVSSNGDGQTVAGVLYANSGDTVTVKLEASEAITGVPTVSIGGENMACALNGTLVTCTLTLSNDETLTAIIAADGAADSAGNGDTTYGDAGVNVQFDFTVPNLTTGITAPAAAAVVTNSAFTVTVNAGEAGLTCKYKVQADGGAVPTFAQMDNYLADLTDNTYTGTAIVPADGTYHIYTSCQDYSGNLGTDDNQDFVVDTTGPAITGVEPDTEDYATGAQTITITSAEAITCYYATDDLKTEVPGTGWTAFATDQGTTSPDTAGLTPAAQGRAFYYVKCEDANGLEMTDNIVVTWTYDNVAPSYDHTVVSTSGSSNDFVKENDTVSIVVVASEVMGTDPTITLGGVAPDVACTETGTNYVCTWTMDADFADASTPDLLVTLGEDLAGNTDTDLTEADIVTVDKSVPTLGTPAPANAATDQTSPVTLSITAGGAETGLDCRYHFSAAKATADIAFASMGYLMFDNADGTYGSYPYLPDGTWFVNIKCWDAAGNEGEFDVAGAGYSFTVGTDPTTVTVDGISATKSWALADDDYDNGWRWEFDVTVPTAEDSLQMKFANWASGSNSIAAADNIRFYSDQADVAVDEDHAIDITVADTYSAVMTLTGDSDTNQSGRQISITVEAKVPVGSATGAYSTSYGIQSL